MTIRERKPGTWQIQVYAGLDPITGSKRYRTQTVHGTEGQALHAENKLKKQVAKDGVPGHTATMRALLDQWYAQRSPDWSPSTAADTRRRIDTVIAPIIGNRRVDKLRGHDLDQFYTHLRRTMAPATVARVHTIVRSALQQAVRWGWITHNPADQATPPQVPPPNITAPTPELVRAVLEGAAQHDPDLGLFLRLAALTGSRRGELVALRWGDLDLETGTCRIERAAVRGDRGPVVKGTKAHLAHTVALDPQTVEQLKFRRRAAARVHHTMALDGLYVFARPDDPTGRTHWYPTTPTLKFGKLRRKLGVTGIRLHDMRHWMGTYGLDGGFSVAAVQRRGGWRHASTLLNNYGHAVSETDRQVATHLAGLLDDQPGG